MTESDFINIDETAALMGVSRNTICQWIQKGLFATATLKGKVMIDKKRLEKLDGWHILAEKQKQLDDYICNVQRQIEENKTKLNDLKATQACNADIGGMREMSRGVLARMWRVLARKMDVSGQNAEMVALALEGRSTAYIAEKMRLSVTSVQTGIRRCFNIMDKLSLQTDLLQKIEMLQNENKQIKAENEIMKQNMRELLNEKKSESLTLTTSEQVKILQTSIIDSTLPSRIKHALFKVGIKSVLDLARIPTKELRGISNLGVKSIDEITQFLDSQHLKPGMGFIINPEKAEIIINN